MFWRRTTFCGIERANFVGEPEDQHPHPTMVAVMGEMLAVPESLVFLVWLTGWAKGKTEMVRRGFTFVRYMAMLRNQAT